MSTGVLVAAAAVFVAVFSYVAPDAGWAEHVSQSAVPYGAVPLAVGLVEWRRSYVTVGLLGAGASTALVVAFYVITPILVDEYALLVTDAVSWTLVGVLSGVVLALVGRWVMRRMSGRPGTWGAWICVALVAAYAAETLLKGWGEVDVATSSGVVTVGYSGTDVIVASVVMMIFLGTTVLVALRQDAHVQDPVTTRA